MTKKYQKCTTMTISSNRPTYYYTNNNITNYCYVSVFTVSGDWRLLEENTCI